MCKTSTHALFSMRRMTVNFLLVSAAVAFCSVADAADREDFTPDDLMNPTKVDIYGSDWGQLGKTRWGNMPGIHIGTAGSTQAHRFVRFNLDTYNGDGPPNIPGQFMKGTEIRTRDRWPLKTGQTLNFTAKIKFPDYGYKGYIPAFYPYTDAGLENDSSEYGQQRNEIDFEFLTKLMGDGTNQKKEIWTNVFKNGTPAAKTVEAPQIILWGNWNTFKISWTKRTVKWFVNDMNKPVRTETVNTPSETVSLGLHFNIWYSATWSDAYDPSFTPVSNSAQNRQMAMDVLEAHVFYLPLKSQGKNTKPKK